MKSVFVRRLEIKIVGMLLVVLAITFTLLYYILSRRIESDLFDSEREKSKMLAMTFHKSIDRSMMNFKADLIRHVVADMRADPPPGMVRFQIVRGKTGNGTEEAFQDFVTLDDVAKRVPGGLRPEWIANHPKKEVNVAEGITHPVFKEAYARYLVNPELPDTYYIEEIAGKPVMTYLKPLPNFPRCFLCHDLDHKTRGVLMISTSIGKLQNEIKESRRYLLWIAFGSVVAVGGLMKLSLGSVVLRPMNRVVTRIEDISEGEGDLTKRVEISSEDEIGRLAAGFNRFTEKMRLLISSVSVAASKVGKTAEEVMGGTREIAEGAKVQIRAVEATVHSLDEMNRSVSAVAGNAETLSTLSGESSAAIQEMTVATGEIARSTVILSSSVDEATSSVVRMSEAVKQISDNAETLSNEAGETSQAMMEMDVSIKEIQRSILQVVDLSKGATANAEEGRQSVEVTMEGMNRIKEYSEEVGRVITGLGKRTQEIGTILNVIDEVAEKTNLLALNAAIIAAQAGEHGKGFGVVANEIKDLAERTAASTKEIHAIISSLQEEGKRAVEAISIGSRRVEEGVRLSRSAQEALIKIVDSINRSTERVGFVALTMEEQSKAVKGVTTAMQHVNQMVQQIAQATGEQGTGSEKIIEATEQMRMITKDLQSATSEQAKGMRRINEIVEEVYKRARQIADSTQAQKKQDEEITRAVDQIKVVSNENIDTVGKVGLAVEDLSKQAKVLQEGIARFKLE